MANYVVHVRSPKPPDEAFAFMADLTNFAKWDPGVVKATQVEGDGPGADAVFDVDVKSIGGPLTLRYRTTTFDPPTKFVAKAASKMLTSLDTVMVRSAKDGSVVSYQAELTLNGILGVADVLLRPVFNRIGDRAAAGLVDALDGEKVGEPS